MQIDQLVVLGEGVSTIYKLFALFGMLIYLSFSIVVIRQSQLMTRTVTGELDRIINIFAWGHFILNAVIFVVVLLFL